MFKDVSLKDVVAIRKSARGRNGWFSPEVIEVQRLLSITYDSIEVALAVYSKRQGNEPPIWLQMPADKAIELAETIKEMATKKAEVVA